MQVYISCPLGVPMDKITEVGKELNAMGYTPWWYERGTKYNDAKLKLSEMFVLMSLHNDFDFRIESMTTGCGSELYLARNLGKELYLAHTKSKGGLKIYPINLTHLEHGRVLGMSGNYLQPRHTRSLIINSYSIY